MFIKILYYLNQLKKTQWWKSEQIAQARCRKMRQVLKYAYERVPYYQRLFDQLKIKPAEIKSEKDLLKLPLLTKKQAQENLPYLFAQGYNPENTCKLYTGGTTGQPSRFYCDEDCLDFYAARKMRVKLAHGMKFGDRWTNWCALRRTDPELYGQRIIDEGKWLREFLLKKLIFKGIDFSILEHPREHLTTLRKFQPTVIQTYTSHLRFLSQIVLEENIQEIRPRLIFQTSELLGQGVREMVRKVFGREIIDIYGLRELGGELAWQCPVSQGYHLNTDTDILEFLDPVTHQPVQSGQRAELVVTTLNNRAMPLIRYQTGDIFILSDKVCSCGRGLTLAKRIEGRNADFLVRPDGQLISPYYLQSGPLENIVGLREYQVIQETPQKIIIKIVKSKNFSEETIREVEKRMNQLLGPGVDLELICLTDILPRESISGKLRVVISKVSLQKYFAQEKYYEEYLYY